MGYKYEAIDAIPQNGAMLERAGIVTSFNSDSDELARRLNTEAAKAVKYGGLSEEAALALVTINPARDQTARQEAAALRESLIQQALPERRKALAAGGDDADKKKTDGPSPDEETGAWARLLLHRAIHHALEHQGPYQDGRDRHNCSNADQ